MGGHSFPEKDESGREFSRNTITTAGWAYLAIHLSMETSKLSSVRAKNCAGTDYVTTMKFYDAEYNGTELVAGTQAELDSSCKRTEITLDLGFDFDLVQGQYSARAKSTTDMFFDVTNGIVSYGDAYTKAFVEHCNLYHLEYIKTNGRQPKKMISNLLAPATTPTNVFKLSFRSPTAGQNHKCQLGFEFYRDIS